MSFDYTIRADGSDALAVSKAVEESLDKVEGAAEGAGAAMVKAFSGQGLKDAQGRFVGIRVSAQQMTDAAKSAGVSVDVLAARMRAASVHAEIMARTQGVLAQNFARVAEQMQRNQAMLDRIHGPERQYAEDIATLNMLMRQGAIDASAYHRQVDQLNASIAQHRGTAKPGGFGAGAAGAVGLGALGPAAAGAAAVAVGREVLQMADAYTNLDNRLKRVTSSESTREDLLRRTHDSANRARTDWSAYGETLVRITNATQHMNLGMARTDRLVETISKAFQMSGATADEASGAMLQLTQAFSSGTLQGDELKTLRESAPDVLRYIAAEMHVSVGQLKKLGSEGKITSDVLVRAFERAQSEIDAGFAKTAPTLSQQWAVFKNDMTEVFGKLAKDTNIIPRIGEALKALANDIVAAVKVIGPLVEALDKIANFKMPGGPAFGEGETTASGAQEIGFADLTYKLPSTLKHLPSRVSEHMEAKRQQEEQAQQIIDAAIAGYTITGDGQLDQVATGMFSANQEAARGAYIAQMTQIIDLQRKFVEQLENGNDSAKDFDKNLDSVFVANIADVTSWSTNMGGAIGYAVDLLKDMSDVVVMTEDALGNLFGADYVNVDALDKSIQDLAGSFDQLGAAVARSDLDAMTEKLGQAANFSSKAAGVLTQAIAGLTAKMASSKDPWKTDGIKAHAGGLSEVEKMYRMIKGPGIEFHKQLKALDELLAKHRITAEEYAKALAKIGETYAGFDIEKILRQAGNPPTVVRGTTAEGYVQGPGGEMTEAAFEHLRQQEEELEQAQREAAANSQPNLEADLKAAEIARENAQATREWARELRGLTADHESLNGLKEGFNAIKQEIMDVDSLIKDKLLDTFHELENQLVNAFTGVETKWEELADQILRDLAKIAIRMLVMSALSGLPFVGSPNIVGGFSFGGAHADGGSYTVPGSGGPDSQNVMFKLTPGERVDFTPPGKTPAGGSVKIVNEWDDRGLLDVARSEEGERVIHNQGFRQTRGRGRRGRRR